MTQQTHTTPMAIWQYYPDLMQRLQRAQNKGRNTTDIMTPATRCASLFSLQHYVETVEAEALR